MANTESLEAIIEEFQARLDQAGLSKLVEVELTPKNKDVSLDRICSKVRGKGNADKTLKILLLLCDECRKDIVLIPRPLNDDECHKNVILVPCSPQDMMSKKQLEKWYESNGFEYESDKTAESVSGMRRRFRPTAKTG